MVVRATRGFVHRVPWAGLALGPGAWAVSTQVDYAFAPWACSLHFNAVPYIALLLVLMSVLGLVTLGIRAWEFAWLNIKWDENAYGSIVWFVLGLHATHLITDVGDTLVLTALMFTRHAHGKRFSDVCDNAFYWNFVVASWIPLYLLIYWGPRLWS